MFEERVNEGENRRMEEKTEIKGEKVDGASEKIVQKKIGVKRFLTIGALFLIFFFLLYSARATPLVSDEKYTYMANLKWYNNYEDGLKAAQEQGKPIFMYFWTIWCTYCEDLHKYVYSDPQVNEILKNDFVLVAIDMDVNKKDTNRFNVNAPPHEIFLTKDGNIITRIPGYIPRDDFLNAALSVLDFVKSKNAEKSKSAHG